MELIPAVRATIGVFKPLEDAVVAEDVLALRQTQGVLVYAFRTGDAKVIVANYAGSLVFRQTLDLHVLQCLDSLLRSDPLVGHLAAEELGLSDTAEASVRKAGGALV